MTRTVAALGLLLALGAAQPACSDPAPESCAETGRCAAGEVCDRLTGQCRPSRAAAEPDDVGRFLSAALGPDGTLHVAAYADAPPGLFYGRMGPGDDDLLMERVLAGRGVGTGTSTAVDAAGNPRIAFFDGSAGALRLAVHNGTNWSIEVVDHGSEQSPRGRFPSLRMDGDGREVIAYRDHAAGAVRVAARQGAGWAVQVADAPEDGPGAGGGRGWDISLTIAGGRPFVAHHDRDGGDLRLLVPGDAGWVVRVFGADPESGEGGGPDWGRFASVAPDRLGNVGVAFVDSTDGTLRVISNERGAIRLEVADDGVRPDEPGPARVVGAFCSLAFDIDGRPSVAYQDGGDGSLRLATRGPDGWASEVVDDTPVSGHGAVLLPAAEHGFVIVHRRLDLEAGGQGRLVVVRR